MRVRWESPVERWPPSQKTWDNLHVVNIGDHTGKIPRRELKSLRDRPQAIFNGVDTYVTLKISPLRWLGGLATNETFKAGVLQ